MSSDYKGKNIFGADIYEGKDGGIYHNKDEAEQSYKQNNNSYDYSSSYSNQNTDYSSQSSYRSYSGGSSGISDSAWDKILGVVLSTVGSWMLTWLTYSIQHSNHSLSVLFKFFSLVSFVFFWPGKILAALIENNTIPGFPLLYIAIPLLNFFWLCLIGKLLLKKSKFNRVFGKFSFKKHRQLSWFKVALVLLSFQLVIALSALL